MVDEKVYCLGGLGDYIPLNCIYADGPINDPRSVVSFVHLPDPITMNDIPRNWILFKKLGPLHWMRRYCNTRQNAIGFCIIIQARTTIAYHTDEIIRFDLIIRYVCHIISANFIQTLYEISIDKFDPANWIRTANNLADLGAPFVVVLEPSIWCWFSIENGVAIGQLK